MAIEIRNSKTLLFATVDGVLLHVLKDGKVVLIVLASHPFMAIAKSNKIGFGHVDIRLLHSIDSHVGLHGKSGFWHDKN